MTLDRPSKSNERMFSTSWSGNSPYMPTSALVRQHCREGIKLLGSCENLPGAIRSCAVGHLVEHLRAVCGLDLSRDLYKARF